MAMPPPSSFDATSTQLIFGIEGIAEKYDGIILDQFGVLHDGKKALAGAREAVEKLLEMKKTVMILSNTTRRSWSCLKLLRELGFPSDKFCGALTSGEHAWHRIRDMVSKGELGRKCLWLGRVYPEKDKKNDEYPNGLGLEFVAHVDDADFILLKGLSVIAKGTGQVRPIGYNFSKSGELRGELKQIFEKAARKKLPVHCLNPDRVSVLPDGSLAYQPGTLASLYKELLRVDGNGKGLVTIYGKPTRESMLQCLAMMKTEASRALMVGDSLEHDIQGANNAGVDSLFIATGIHSSHTISRMPSRVFSSTCAALVAAGTWVLSAGSGSPKMFGIALIASIIQLTGAVRCYASLQGRKFTLDWNPLDMDALETLCQKHRAKPTYFSRYFSWH
mmetsp:Transcript_30782/g.75049  ORF Transcript_30782/g.75049 Transcript_30782/m.75049 type:complete len:390 (-) Transcript_30782:240-1409(-)